MSTGGSYFQTAHRCTADQAALTLLVLRHMSIGVDPIAIVIVQSHVAKRLLVCLHYYHVLCRARLVSGRLPMIPVLATSRLTVAFRQGLATTSL